jgi:hypothetical protein
VAKIWDNSSLSLVKTIQFKSQTLQTSAITAIAVTKDLSALCVGL